MAAASGVKNGVIEIEVPRKGSIFVVPRPVDTSTGVWRATKMLTAFEEKSGTSVESRASFEWPGGTTAELTFRATIESGGVRIGLSWATEGDAKGHIRTDILIPYDIAHRLRITGANGKVVFKDGRPAAMADLPATFLDTADDEVLFVLQGDYLRIQCSQDADFEGKGMQARLSPYKTGLDAVLSEASGMEFFIAFD